MARELGGEFVVARHSSDDLAQIIGRRAALHLSLTVLLFLFLLVRSVVVVVVVVVRLDEIRYFRLLTDLDDSFGVETERLYRGQIVPAGGVFARILSRRRRAAVVFVHGGSSVARGRRREKANADANRHARANHLGSVFVPASFGAAQHEELRFV